MTSSKCPPDEGLRAYASGRLSQAEAETIDQHVELCPTCLERLDLCVRSSGSLAEALRKVPEFGQRESEIPPLKRAIAAVLGTDHFEPQNDTRPSCDDSVALSGSIVGGYRIIAEIGRGGIGRVYQASHPRLGQDVALKMLKTSVRSGQVLARFQAESQALLRMDHPGIARVLDGGATEDGQPFFVMELVRGTAITKYCYQQRLNISQRLDLFLQVCSAVQHAHQKAIIHRDIKPSNVMVTEYDGRPVVKVIDFGIAKVLDQTDGESTQDGMIVGTPEYMSPEQAGLRTGDIDTRSDVFALGVLLYELLTESSPFRQADEKSVAVLEQLRRVREDELIPPFVRLRQNPERVAVAGRFQTTPERLARQLRFELTWVVTRSVEKDPERRYESVGAFAEDVRRFINNEAVVAARPSRWYRIRKLVSRHRVPVILTTLLFSAMLAGSLGTYSGMVQASRERDEKADALTQVVEERDRTAEALRSEEAARQKAETANSQAVTALQTLTEESVSRFLSSRNAITEEDRQFLEQIIRQLEQFTASSDNSMASRVVMADGLNQVGSLQRRLGNSGDAAASYQRSIDVWKQVCSEPGAKPEYHRGMADSYSNLGIALAELQRFEESEAAHLEAIKRHSELAEAWPENVSYKRNVANCRNSYGVMLKDVKRNLETIEQYRLALEIYDELSKKFPDDMDLLDSMSGPRNNMGIELALVGRYDESQVAHEAVIELREKLVRHAPDDPDRRHELAAAYSNLGMLQALQKQYEKALPNYERCEEQCLRLTAEFPAVPVYRRTLQGCLSAMGRIYSLQNRHLEAEQTYHQYVVLTKQLQREDPASRETEIEVAQGYGKQAVALSRLKEYARAAEAGQNSAEIYRSLIEKGQGDAEVRFSLANILTLLSSMLKSSGDNEAALSRCTEAIGLLTANAETGSSSDQTNKLQIALLKEQAILLGQLKRYQEAVAAWDHVLTKEEPATVQTQLRRLVCLCHEKPAEAIAEAASLTADAQLPKDAGSLFYSARIHATASVRLSEKSDQEQAAGTAMKVLQSLQEAGFFKLSENMEVLKTHADLNPLRERPDFQSLLSNTE